MGENREVEHVLPKSKYPEYAIFIPNLVCSCGKCNKKKPDDIPFRENKNMYPHPRYELYQSFEIEIKLKLDGEVLFNKSNIIYYGNNKIVEKWNKLRDDLDINKRISENPVKAECDKILKLIRKSKSPNYIIEKYKIKLEDEDYSTELEKQIYIGLIKALIEIIEEK